MKIRAERKARTREALLDSAAGVFSARGYHDASLEEIAKGAGVSTGAVYSSFAGKDDLFLTLVEREIGREFESFVAEMTAGEDPVERLIRAANQYMEFIRREPGLARLSTEFWGRAVRDPEIRPRYAEHRAVRTTAIAALVAATIAESGIETDVDPRHVAVAIEGLAEGVTMRWIATPGEVPDDLLGQMLTFALEGMLSAQRAT